MPTVSPSRILLIDDEPQVRHSINRLLKQAGYVVLTHDGGPGCSYEAARFVPDLVLVDVKMPFLSGDSLVSLLGESASITPPIILLYSGIDRDALEKMAKTCGADGYISKSDSGLELSRIIARYLRARTRTLSILPGEMRQR